MYTQQHTLVSNHTTSVSSSNLHPATQTDLYNYTACVYTQQHTQVSNHTTGV